MNISLEVQNKDTGAVIDLSKATDDITVVWERIGQAGRLEANLHNIQRVYIPKGSPVFLKVNGTLFFKGYFFTNTFDRWGNTKIVVYDALRYLKAKSSIMIQNNTASQLLVELIAKDFVDTGTFPLGAVEDTQYQIPWIMYEDKSYLDMLSDALKRTLLATGIVYNLYDDCGKLRITKAGNMIVPGTLTYGKEILDYKYTGTIDEDTYNSYRYVFSAVATGKNEFPFDDANNIRKWGLLQRYEVLSDNLNIAQLQAMAQATQLFYNRELKKVEIESLGRTNIRAGSMIDVNLGTIDNTEIRGLQLVNYVKHTFTNQLHKMHIRTQEIRNISAADWAKINVWAKSNEELYQQQKQQKNS